MTSNAELFISDDLGLIETSFQLSPLIHGVYEEKNSRMSQSSRNKCTFI